MPLRNTAEHYGALAKLLHWTIVVLIVVQYFLAEYADELPDGIEKLRILSRHKSIGMLVLMLAIVRILWKLANRGLPEPASTGLLRRAATTGHGLLYLLILLQQPPGPRLDVRSQLRVVTWAELTSPWFLLRSGMRTGPSRLKFGTSRQHAE